MSAEQEQPPPPMEIQQPPDAMQPNPVAGQPVPTPGPAPITAQPDQAQQPQRPMNMAPGMMQSQPADQQSGNSGAPQVKTPEQLFQELQRLQQQQQQQQQKQ